MNDVFAGDLHLVLLIMLMCGLIGGIVNFYFVPAAAGQPANSWLRSVVMGIGASTLVPIFLFVTQSKLLDNLFNPVNADLTLAIKSLNTLIFISLCLLAAISSSRFIASISDQVIAQLARKVDQNTSDIAQTQNEVADVKTDAQQASVTAEAAVAKLVENRSTIQALKSMQRARKTSNPVMQTGSTDAQPSAIRAQTQPDKDILPSVMHEDDPQKDRWGGQSSRNGFHLTASVNPVDSDDDLFKISLRVAFDSAKNKMENGQNRKLTSSSIPELSAEHEVVAADSIVIFYLHDTFDPPVRAVAMHQYVATLDLFAWGAFTVGAVLTDGTQLELDLADPLAVPNAPQSFRKR